MDALKVPHRAPCSAAPEAHLAQGLSPSCAHRGGGQVARRRRPNAERWRDGVPPCGGLKRLSIDFKCVMKRLPGPWGPETPRPAGEPTYPTPPLRVCPGPGRADGYLITSQPPLSIPFILHTFCGPPATAAPTMHIAATSGCRGRALAGLPLLALTLLALFAAPAAAQT